MEQSTKEAWRRLLDEARRELPDATVRTWLEPAVPIALDDDRLIVGAPDQFAVEWNEQKHSSVLAPAAERGFGRPTGVVRFVVDEVQWLVGKAMTQDGCLRAYSALFAGNKRSVRSAERPAKEMRGVEGRRMARVEWGLVADIGHRGLEHRIAILRKKA